MFGKKFDELNKSEQDQIHSEYELDTKESLDFGCDECGGELRKNADGKIQCKKCGMLYSNLADRRVGEERIVYTNASSNYVFRMK